MGDVSPKLQACFSFRSCLKLRAPYGKLCSLASSAKVHVRGFHSYAFLAYLTTRSISQNVQCTKSPF